MSTLDEYLMIGLRVFEQWRPRFSIHPARQVPADESSAELEAESMTGISVLETDEDAALTMEQPTRENQAWPPSMETIVECGGEFPPYSVVLGTGEDGLPFLLDLTNPAPGSFLIAGDSSSGKARLLNAMLNSAVALNDPHQVAFNLISSDPDDFAELGQTDHCQRILHKDSFDLEELIEELAGIVEERRRNWMQDPVSILAINDLDTCLDVLDDQAYSRLHWLIKHGPRSRVWTMATLCTDKGVEIEPRFLFAFRTRLLCHIADDALACYLSGDEIITAQDLESGSQFSMPCAGEWLRLWICN